MRTSVSPRALSMECCTKCWGTGRVAKGVCNCVYRAIFRTCLKKWRSSTNWGTFVPGMAITGLSHTGLSFGYPRIEYTADFEAVARRALTETSVEWLVFRLHYLAEMDWRVCVPAINRHLRPQPAIDRGAFFHAAYRTERVVGRACVDQEPYALFPTDEYFSRRWLSADGFGKPRKYGRFYGWANADLESYCLRFGIPDERAANREVV